MVDGPLTAGAVIGALIRHEGDVARLYRVYAGLFPALATFWEGLAADEDAHARQLHQLAERMRKGEFALAPQHLKLGAISQAMSLVENQFALARCDPVTVGQALRAAIAIEAQTVEGIAFGQVTDVAVAPDVRQFLLSLRDAEERHRQVLQAKLQEMAGPGAGKRR